MIKQVEPCHVNSSSAPVPAYLSLNPDTMGAPATRKLTQVPIPAPIIAHACTVAGTINRISSEASGTQAADNDIITQNSNHNDVMEDVDMRQTKRRVTGIHRFISTLFFTIAIQATPQAAIVDIVESFDSGSGAGTYTVTNNSASATNGFYIANDTATFVDIVNGSLTHWSGRTFSRAEWESGVGFGFADGTSFSTIGTDWETLFPGFSQVIGYWNDIEIAPTGIQPIAPGATFGGFECEAALPSSPFLAVFNDGSSWSRTFSAAARRCLTGTTTPRLDPGNTAGIVVIKPINQRLKFATNPTALEGHWSG